MQRYALMRFGLSLFIGLGCWSASEGTVSALPISVEHAFVDNRETCGPSVKLADPAPTMPVLVCPNATVVILLLNFSPPEPELLQMTLAVSGAPVTTASQRIEADLVHTGLQTALPLNTHDCCYIPTPVTLAIELRTLDGTTLLAGRTFAFDLIQPVPEPISLLLFGTTTAGLAVTAWRRRRHA